MSNATCVVTYSYQENDYHCSICPPFYDGKDCSKGISSSASSISILFFSTRFQSFPYVSFCYSLVSLQAVVVRSTDNGIHRIDHVSIWLIAQYVFLTLIYWITILPLGSVIGPLNNWALLVAKVSLWFHKNEKKKPSATRERKTFARGESECRRGGGGGGLGQFALTFFLFRIFLS